MVGCSDAVLGKAAPLRCRQCGGDRMIALTFPDDEPQVGFGQRTSGPPRATAKCASFGSRHLTRVHGNA
jgi:hypothetical protein